MRMGEQIWHCKRKEIPNAEIPEFELPKRITLRLGYFTVQPRSLKGGAYSDLLEYGEEIKNYRAAVAQPYEKWVGVFTEGDRAYLDGKKPTEEDLEDNYADNANYIVDSVQPQNKAIQIIFKKRTAE